MQAFVKAARELAADRVLRDPSDNDIVLAVVEMVLGRWPEEGVDRSVAMRIVTAYDQEDGRIQNG